MDYHELDRLIDQLTSSVEATDPQKGYWKELWGLAGNIGAGFKGMRYPTREEKEAAWQRFQKLCDKAKARSEQNRQRVEQGNREWDDRKRKSEQARGRVESRAAGARPLSSLERGKQPGIIRSPPNTAGWVERN